MSETNLQLGGGYIYQWECSILLALNYFYEPVVYNRPLFGLISDFLGQVDEILLEGKDIEGGTELEDINLLSGDRRILIQVKTKQAEGIQWKLSDPLLLKALFKFYDGVPFEKNAENTHFVFLSNRPFNRDLVKVIAAVKEMNLSNCVKVDKLQEYLNNYAQKNDRDPVDNQRFHELLSKTVFVNYLSVDEVKANIQAKLQALNVRNWTQAHTVLFEAFTRLSTQLDGGTVTRATLKELIPIRAEEAIVDDTPKTPPLPIPLQSLNVTSNEFFTARQREIIWLLDALQPKRIVTLWGPGGIGKSAIAQATLEQLSPDNKPPQRFPEGVIVHSFYGQPDTASFAAHIVRSLVGESAQDVSAAAAQRALGNKKLLLVLDGTEEAADLGAVLRLCGDNGVLTTTRNKGDARSPQWRLPVETLPLDDAWKLLHKWGLEGMTEPLGRQTCQFVDGWPLAIQIIGDYLDATSEPPYEYWDWLEGAPIDALSFGQNREKSVGILLDRSRERLGDGAKQILGVVGLLAPASIDRELIMTSLSLPKQDSQRAMGELLRYGLLRQQDNQIEVSHALIHSYARRQPSPAREVVSSLAINIQDKVDSLSPTPVLLFDWLPHFRAITDYVLNQAEDSVGAKLCITLGNALLLIADYDSAQIYYKRALAISEDILGAEHPDTALCLNNLGLLLHAQGSYTGAKSYYEQALAIREKALGIDHPIVAQSLTNLGFLMRVQGDYVGARQYLERALAIRETALGPEHPGTASVLNNLGGFFYAQGDYVGARPYYERALAIREKALGPDHPVTSTSLNNLGGLLRAQRDYVGARLYYERALAIREKALGPDHPITATSLTNLGFLMRVQGDYEGARSYYERALAIYEKSLGPDHPDTAASLTNLGFLMGVQGDYEGARSYYERALAIREKALGPDHQYTVRSMINLRKLLRSQGRL